MNQPIVVTHANAFHPDEILAICFLEKFYFHESVSVIRTRDEKALKKYRQDPNCFVIDVGAEFNSDLKNFDHHQKEMTQTWPNGTPFSSCGLIWHYLRQEGFLNECAPELLDRFEARLVLPADRLDNGLENWPEGNMIFAYNRPAADQNNQFEKARQVARDLIDNVFYDLHKELEVRQAIRHALTHHFDETYGVVLVPPNNAPLTRSWVVEESNGQVNMMIVERPQKKGQPQQWMLLSAVDDLQDQFSVKTMPPQDWLGRNHFKVHLDEGVVNMIFCHKTGFLSIVEGDQKNAWLAARHLVKKANLMNQSKPGVTLKS